MAGQKTWEDPAAQRRTPEICAGSPRAFSSAVIHACSRSTRVQAKDHPGIRGKHPRTEVTLDGDHAGQRSRWAEVTLGRDHAGQRSRWAEITQDRDHAGQRSRWIEVTLPKAAILENPRDAWRMWGKENRQVSPPEPELTADQALPWSA